MSLTDNRRPADYYSLPVTRATNAHVALLVVLLVLTAVNTIALVFVVKWIIEVTRYAEAIGNSFGGW